MWQNYFDSEGKNEFMSGTFVIILKLTDTQRDNQVEHIWLKGCQVIHRKHDLVTLLILISFS